MKIQIPVKYAKLYGEENDRFERHLKKALYMYRDDDSVSLDISLMEADELNAFHDVIKSVGDPLLKGVLDRMAVYYKMKSDPENYDLNTDLVALPSALKEYIGLKSDRRWLFKMEADNMKVPYLVTNIAHHERTDYQPANVVVSLAARYLDKVKEARITIHQHDLFIKGSKKSAKMRAYQLIDKFGYIIGEETMCKSYDEELAVFLDYRRQIGEQFVSNGTAFSNSEYNRVAVSMHTDGVSHKLVVDEPFAIKAEDEYTSNAFWDADKDSGVAVPVHPYIRVFNLKDHRGYSVHTSTIKPYVYNPGLIEKLILPPEVKELIEILGHGTKEGLGDIISGKAEGIIIGCLGGPGLGKTLTGEIYSEFLERPLYSVQCAQLGTKPDDLEKRLNVVLERAQKWNAVLLLDEADVYIRKRGQDIEQNAIVGVFLRVLEYYRGVLFLTSNLEDVIDDAIESRFAAKIVYPRPDTEAATKIWNIQIDNHGWKDVKGKNDIINAMVSEYAGFSGRSIRNLLKLATLLAKFRKQELTIEILKHAAKFAVHEKKKDDK